MRVGELIEALSRMDPDTPVVLAKDPQNRCEADVPIETQDCPFPLKDVSVDGFIAPEDARPNLDDDGTMCVAVIWY